jgi:hypothetical protein
MERFDLEAKSAYEFLTTRRLSTSSGGAGVLPVSPPRHTVFKLMGGEQAFVAKAGQRGLDLGQRTSQEAEGGVTVWLCESRGAEALDETAARST